MTPADMRAWRSAMDYTQPQAAQALGVSLRTVKSWESGFAAPPAFLALACAALAAGLG
jgi:DNA-binding transcriptional regulator YiaG